MITYDDLTPCINNRISNLQGRIGTGIAYDFDRMSKVWMAEIELLKNTLEFLNKQNDIKEKEGEQDE